MGDPTEVSESWLPRVPRTRVTTVTSDGTVTPWEVTVNETTNPELCGTRAAGFAAVTVAVPRVTP